MVPVCRVSTKDESKRTSCSRIALKVSRRLCAELEAILPTFYEFFAGGGMVRAGLGSKWQCLFANDFDIKKSATYRTNWGEEELKTADVRSLELADLPIQTPDMVWASFPCQDLSLAGGGAGLRGDRSGTFWPFWSLVGKMKRAKRQPSIIVLENVCGTLTSHGGKDFAAIVGAFADLGYDVGALVVDAELFLPQSRPRLFFVGVPRTRTQKVFELSDGVADAWRTSALLRAYSSLSNELKRSWIWWDMAAPRKRTKRFADLIESNPDPKDVQWHTAEETKRLLDMMTPLHRKKVDQARASKQLMVGTMYRRTRPDEKDIGVQRIEVRFDDVAGCLRTPAGGSSRQLLLVVDGSRIRSRLISARETARLMGLPDSYALPDRYNEAYHLTGDGVVVPVVRHLSEQILIPQLEGGAREVAREICTRG